METVISREAALKELEGIQEIFDVIYDENDKEKILPAIMAGRFTIDEAEEIVMYQLYKPISQKNGEAKETITFRTPTISDMEYINKGLTIKVDDKGDTIMDLGEVQVHTKRAVIKLSRWPLGLVERISRKDMRVFAGLFNFFE